MSRTLSEFVEDWLGLRAPPDGSSRLVLASSAASRPGEPDPAARARFADRAGGVFGDRGRFKAEIHVKERKSELVGHIYVNMFSYISLVAPLA